MSRHPPSIVRVSPTEDGIEIAWEVDSFFADPEAPEQVRVDVQGIPYALLDGDADSEEIPLDALSALQVPVVALSVSFLWQGSPGEELQSSVLLPLAVGAGTGSGGVLPAAQPVVELVAVRRRTRQTPSQIEIHWRSNNYNDGNIFWGPPGYERAFVKNIRPRGEVYEGTFTTDRTLVAATFYTFTVEVRNTLHSPGWLATSIVVRSPPDYVSLRRFLIDTGTPVQTGVRSLVGAERSVRRLIVG